MNKDQPLCALLEAPRAGEDRLQWFERIADALLRRTSLEVDGEAHELCEIEFYLHGEDHPDPFTHNQPIQRSSCRWYFHSAGGSYRGGSYKGLDLTFGPREQFGGILIRSLLTGAGELINGSSLCVDHLLARTGHATVASLAAAVAEHPADSPSTPLRLRPVPGRARTIHTTARVGLTLKRVDQHPEMLQYILRPYRRLTRPRAIKKGRVYLICALLRAGEDEAAIAALTGTPKRTVAAYRAAYARGRARGSTTPLHGRSLSSTELCELHGALEDTLGG